MCAKSKVLFRPYPVSPCTVQCLSTSAVVTGNGLSADMQTNSNDTAAVTEPTGPSSVPAAIPARPAAPPVNAGAPQSPAFAPMTCVDIATFLSIPADLSFLYDSSHPATEWLLGVYEKPSPFSDAARIPHVLEVACTRVTVGPSKFIVNPSRADAQNECVNSTTQQPSPAGSRNQADPTAKQGTCLDEIYLLEYELESSEKAPRLALGHVYGVESHLATIGPIPELPVAPGEPQPKLASSMARRFAHFFAEHGSYRVIVSRLGKGVFVVVLNCAPCSPLILPCPDGLAAESNLYLIYDPRDGLDGALSRSASVVTSSLSCHGWGCLSCNPNAPFGVLRSPGWTCSHALLKGLTGFARWAKAMKEYLVKLTVYEEWSSANTFLFRRADRTTGLPAMKVRLTIPLSVGYDVDFASQTERARNLTLKCFELNKMLYSEPQIGRFLALVDPRELPAGESSQSQGKVEMQAPRLENGEGRIRCRLGCDRVFGRAQER